MPEEFTYDRILALLFGISDYSSWKVPYGSFENLVGIEESIEKLEEWLIESCNATIINRTKDTQINVHTHDIDQYISDLGDMLAQEKELYPKTAVLVYIAGHGKKSSQAPEDLGYFLGPRIKNDRFTKRDILSMSNFSGDFLAQLSDAYHVLFILDCCYAGIALTESGKAFEQKMSTVTEEHLESALSSKAAQLVTVTKNDSPAFTTPQGTRFIKAFFEALGNFQGTATIRDLVGHTRQNSKTWRQHANIKSLSTKDEGDFVLGIRAKEQTFGVLLEHQDITLLEQPLPQEPNEQKGNQNNKENSKETNIKRFIREIPSSQEEELSQENDDSQCFRPKLFLKKRRPEQFSDSLTPVPPEISRKYLEFCISSISDRVEEYKFVTLCRQLAEREIAPNIKPHTNFQEENPVTTHPVAPSMEFRAYWALPTSESWIFFFSTKQDWITHISKCVNNLIRKKIEFQEIFFLANQAIEDTKRTAIEVKYREKGLKITILDRSWIISRSIEHKHYDILSTYLDLKQKPEFNLGPSDREKQEQIKIIEERLGNTQSNNFTPYELVEEYLQAGVLLRELEESRIRTESFFERAKQIAITSGFISQIIRAIYQYAWTSFWWFEDFEKFNELNEELLSHLKDSEYAEDLSLASNLQFLSITSHEEKSTNSEKRLNQFDQIKELIAKQSEQTSRPNNSLHARTVGVMLDFSQALYEQTKLPKVFKDFGSCIDDSRKLSTYPLMKFVDLIFEMGDFFGHLDEYDILFNKLGEVIEEREGEIQKGKLLLRRGHQLLNANQPRKALALLGEAKIKLAKDETLVKSAISSYLCGSAYERLGLYWAARAEYVVAVDLGTLSVKSASPPPSVVIKSAMRVAWLEIKIGRVPCFLAWYMFSQLLARSSKLNDEDELIHEYMAQDLTFGILLLKTPYNKLESLSSITPKLQELDLKTSRISALFAIGEEESAFQESKNILELNNKEEFNEFIALCMEQPATTEIAEYPLFHGEKTETYISQVLGTSIKITTDNTIQSILIGEHIILLFEALLATATPKDIIFAQSKVEFTLQLDEQNSQALKVEERKNGTDISWKILVPKDIIAQVETDKFESLSQWLMELSAIVMGTTCIFIDDLKVSLDKLYNEKGFDRALSFPLITILEKLGLTSYYKISMWSDLNTPTKVQRKEQWLPPQSTKPFKDKEKSSNSKEYKSIEELNHQEIKNVEFVGLRLQQQANWKGTAFIAAPFSRNPPVMGIIFENYDLGVSVFQRLIELSGNVDENRNLNISIILGGNPEGSYVVMIAPGTNFLKTLKSTYYQMSPLQSKAISSSQKSKTARTMFIEEYKKKGMFILTPLRFPIETFSGPDPRVSILIKDLNIRNVNEIEDHEIEVTGRNLALDPSI